MVRVTRNEATARLKVSKSTLDRMIKRGELVTETEQHGQRHTVWILMDGLVDLFDLVEKMEFERLPQMADCSARRALDDRLSSILGLPDLSGLRELLATEPVVSDERL